MRCIRLNGLRLQDEDQGSGPSGPRRSGPPPLSRASSFSHADKGGRHDFEDQPTFGHHRFGSRSPTDTPDPMPPESLPNAWRPGSPSNQPSRKSSFDSELEGQHSPPASPSRPKSNFRRTSDTGLDGLRSRPRSEQLAAHSYMYNHNSATRSRRRLAS